MAAKVLLILGSGFMAGEFHHWFGVAPVLAGILCAAFFLKPRELFLVGVGGILFRDLLVGMDGVTPFRILGIIGVVGAVAALRVQPNVKSLLTGLLAASPIFHLALAVGDWATGTCTIWPKTAQGLRDAVVTSLPYFQRSFVGDLIFTSLFLGLYLGAAYTLGGWRPLRVRS